MGRPRYTSWGQLLPQSSLNFDLLFGDNNASWDSDAGIMWRKSLDAEFCVECLIEEVSVQLTHFKLMPSRYQSIADVEAP